jgi:hypothetical protein
MAGQYYFLAGKSMCRIGSSKTHSKWVSLPHLKTPLQIKGSLPSMFEENIGGGDDVKDEGEAGRKCTSTSSSTIPYHPLSFHTCSVLFGLDTI